MPALIQQPFGTLPSGEKIAQYILTNAEGLTIKLINYGATLASLQVPTEKNSLAELVLGFDTLEEYIHHPFYFGCTIGRVANRIAKGHFSYQKKSFPLACNENSVCHLHGGNKGFDKVVWRAQPFQNKNNGGIVFSYLSPQGEEGYPGNLAINTTYTLTDNNELKIAFLATTDQPTPVNLTNHTYWNLTGESNTSILGHELQLASDYYIDTDENHIPTGKILPVENTIFDFRTPRNIHHGMYDHCYTLPHSTHQPQLVASVRDPSSNRIMETYTTQPGLQLYTGNYLVDYNIANNKKISQHSGFCLETQGFPDALNHENFPSIILLPENSYSYETIYKLLWLVTRD